MTPVVARPRRLTKVCWLVAALVVVVFGILAVALGRGPEGDARFRIADQVAFFYLGELIEVAPAADMFTAPKHPKTQEYITGRFG